MMSELLTHIDGRGVATVTMNRPLVHNAFDPVLIASLTYAFTTLNADDNVRAVVLKGAGKSFSAGADLTWMQEAAKYSKEQNRVDAVLLSNMLVAIDGCSKPVIALVQGLAMGGGVGLTACADIAIAHTDTKFALSEVKLGLTPATISPFVMRAIGAKNCRRLFLTAERFTAAEAKDYGLISEVAEDVEAKAEEFIAVLLKNSPKAMAAAKVLINSIENQEITPDILSMTADEIAERRTSDEGQEGLAAFLEKRKPNWIKE